VLAVVGGGTREYEIPGPAAPGNRVVCAHGAAVPAAGGAGTLGADDGWFTIWMLWVGVEALGSISHENRDPKGKC
jgi:hypothetical protein